jgi:cell division septation protein DedD
MAGSEDTEITLGVGKLLGLFFVLVALCGLALGAGYWLGRNSAKLAVAAAPAASASPAAASSAVKPGASQGAAPKAPDCNGGDCAAATAASNAASPEASDLTFYQAVQAKEAHPQLTRPAEAPAPAPAEAHGSLGSGYMVQIAAVRNEDDAKMLSATLQKQQYPAVIVQPGDKLFHVQVGPYVDVKEAEAIRTRLAGAGYSNAFLKH